MTKTLILAIAVLVTCDEAAAQAFKGADAAGTITASSMRGRERGLPDAGEVQDRVQVQPARPPSKPPARTSASSPPPTEKPAAAQETAKPERRCFTTTVKGKSVTRCNDKPDDE